MKIAVLLLTISITLLATGCVTFSLGPNGEIEFKAKVPESEE